MKIDKPDNAKIGRFGEKAAAKYLKKHKYKIVAKNVREGHSEIDIIAKTKDTLVFVEVKTRTRCGDAPVYSRPADAVNKSKITYLIRGADRFCGEHGEKYAHYFKRFDIIEVYLDGNAAGLKVTDIRHFENAFRRN